MKTSNPLWREQLIGRCRRHWRARLTFFEAEISLKKLRKLDDRVFAETRLRRGVYGQRYDNGERHDGKKYSRWPIHGGN